MPSLTPVYQEPEQGEEHQRITPPWKERLTACWLIGNDLHMPLPHGSLIANVRDSKTPPLSYLPLSNSGEQKLAEHLPEGVERELQELPLKSGRPQHPALAANKFDEF
jgi:hypothetical protein